ncbi:MAG: antibiotic biosynthesis monooxygenase [Chloroflexota bacterium]|nr:antibiotic biosynthesis monooxygenase [Chloroflexota bacterium]
MVLYVLKWDIPPETRAEYARWLVPAIERSLAVPGVIEYRAYATIAGPTRKVATYEFANLDDWEAWYSHPSIQRMLEEWQTVTTNRTRDLWGPEAMMIRPNEAQ